MRILIEHPTIVGIFSICQSSDRKYHPIFDDESLGTYNSVQDAVDGLLANDTLDLKHPETDEKLSINDLDIATDYLEWNSAY